MKKRRVFLIAAVLILGGATGALVYYRVTKKEAAYQRITTEEVEKAAAILTSDGDKDALMDWEEGLWKTDPKNPDSDGDGTGDGEEIRLGRNPLVAGPGDALDPETVEKKTTLKNDGGAKANELARTLFGNYLAAKEGGAPLTAEDERSIIEETLRRYEPAPPKKTFVLGEILVSAQNDESAYRAYANAVGTALLARKQPDAENELDIFERALENDDESELAALQARARRYEELIGDLRTIPAPINLREPHRALLNALETLQESVLGMERSLREPVNALGSVAAYPYGIQALGDAFSRIATILIAKKISFRDDEPGGLLVR